MAGDSTTGRGSTRSAGRPFRLASGVHLAILSCILLAHLGSGREVGSGMKGCCKPEEKCGLAYTCRQAAVASAARCCKLGTQDPCGDTSSDMCYLPAMAGLQFGISAEHCASGVCAPALRAFSSGGLAPPSASGSNQPSSLHVPWGVRRTGPDEQDSQDKTYDREEQVQEKGDGTDELPSLIVDDPFDLEKMRQGAGSG